MLGSTCAEGYAHGSDENEGGRGGKHQQKTRKAVRRLKCKVPGCRAKAIQIRDLVKSRMPEIVEPKQLIQSRVLVRRARLTVKRGAARPNGKPKPPQNPLRRAVRYRIRGAGIRHKTTVLPFAPSTWRTLACKVAPKPRKPI